VFWECFSVIKVNAQFLEGKGEFATCFDDASKGKYF
jgi:hypothetical protein